MFTIALVIYFSVDVDSKKQEKGEKKITEPVNTVVSSHIEKQVSMYKRSTNFWLHFIINMYLTAVPIFFNINIKVTGLEYFTAEQVDMLTYCQTFALLISTIGMGVFMDKFGSKLSLLTMFSILTFFLVVYLNFRSTFWIFAMCNTAFYIIHGCADTFKGVCLQSIYSSEIAVNLQPVFHMSKPLAAVLTF